jgi:hypothetical protein
MIERNRIDRHYERIGEKFGIYNMNGGDLGRGWGVRVEDASTLEQLNHYLALTCEGCQTLKQKEKRCNDVTIHKESPQNRGP